MDGKCRRNEKCMSIDCIRDALDTGNSNEIESHYRMAVYVWSRGLRGFLVKFDMKFKSALPHETLKLIPNLMK